MIHFMKHIKMGFIICLTILAYSSSGQTYQEAAYLTEQQKIDYLIKCVEDLKNAKFDRNGTLYDAQAAAAHLKMKREKAGNAIKNVDDFIEKVASKSSSSGIPYKIIYDNGKVLLAKDFYLGCLKELDLKNIP
jgi:hypothetical protein